MMKFNKQDQKEFEKVIKWNADWSELDQSFQDKLYEYFYNIMPYGVAKGRTGTADQWYSDNIEEVENIVMEK